MTLAACNSQDYTIEVNTSPSSGQLYLYGETHGNAKITEAELELWQSHYAEYDMRHLFLEFPYYTAGVLKSLDAGRC